MTPPRPSPSPRSARTPPPAPLGRRSGPAAAALLGLLALLSACRDSPTDPLTGLVAAETGRAALALELPLPAPALDSRDSDDEANALVAAWRASWEEPTLEGRRRRQELYPALGRLLADRRPREALAEEMALLGAGVRRASQLDASTLPEFLDAGIRRALESHRRGARAVATGDEERGWILLLQGADALREVGPEAVARTAVGAVEEELRRIPADASYSETELERIRHLVRGSRQALEEAEWGLAIRRAHYAEGLLAGNG